MNYANRIRAFRRFPRRDRNFGGAVAVCLSPLLRRGSALAHFLLRNLNGPPAVREIKRKIKVELHLRGYNDRILRRKAACAFRSGAKIWKGGASMARTFEVINKADRRDTDSATVQAASLSE